MRTVNVAREFLQGCADAHSEEKKEALTIAAARQFDPRFGPQTARAHWFFRLRNLTDVQVTFLVLLARYGEHALVTVHRDHLIVNVWRKSDGKMIHVRSDESPVLLSESEAAAYREAGNALCSPLAIPPAGGLCEQDVNGGFMLTSSGLQVGLLASERPPPAHPSG